jgi:ribosomal subunit interface protein
MEITIKATNIKLNEPLRIFINDKIGELKKFTDILKEEKYLDKIFRKMKSRTVVWVEIEKTTSHHSKGKVFRAEVQIRLPKGTIRAESTQDDLRVAIVEVKNQLQRAIKQYKEKNKAIKGRKVKKFKELFRFSSSARFKKKK